MTKVKECNCIHHYQDQQYGFRKRLHNFAPKGSNGSAGWRCTVCTKVKQA